MTNYDVGRISREPICKAVAFASFTIPGLDSAVGGLYAQADAFEPTKPISFYELFSAVRVARASEPVRLAEAVADSTGELLLLEDFVTLEAVKKGDIFGAKKALACVNHSRVYGDKAHEGFKALLRDGMGADELITRGDYIDWRRSIAAQKSYFSDALARAVHSYVERQGAGAKASLIDYVLGIAEAIRDGLGGVAPSGDPVSTGVPVVSTELPSPEPILLIPPGMPISAFSAGLPVRTENGLIVIGDGTGQTFTVTNAVPPSPEDSDQQS